METNHQKGLTNQGLTPLHTLTILLTLTMIGVCLYLTKEYYGSHFNTSLSNQDSLCNINAFFTCSHTTNSALGSILGVPTSIYGLFLGIIILLGSIFPSVQYEKNSYFLLLLNSIGCLILLIYSLFALGALCPMCTVYYLLSFALLFIFFKKSPFTPLPSVKILGIAAAGFLITAFFIRSDIQTKKERIVRSNKRIISAFGKLKTTKDPSFRSNFRIATASNEFKNAPIRVSIFSDFQCPFCKNLNDTLHPILDEFEGKINAEYFFYPLDSNCNYSLSRQIHPYACLAAKVSICSENFKSMHDLILDNQAQLSESYLNDLIKNNNLSECVKSPDTQSTLLKHIKMASDEFKITGTPAIFINGKRIKPLSQSMYRALFSDLIKK